MGTWTLGLHGSPSIQRYHKLRTLRAIMQLHKANRVSREGIEPSTNRLKVCCSTD